MYNGTKTATTATGLALAALLAAGVVVAGQRAMDRPHDGHGGHGGPMSFLSQLNLSDDQKAQVKTILDDEHAKMAPLADGSMKAHRALNDAIHASTFDEGAVRAAATQAAGVEGDLAVERARLASRIRGVLTADQQKQLDVLRKQALDRMQQRAAQHRAAWSEDSEESEDGETQ